MFASLYENIAIRIYGFLNNNTKVANTNLMKLCIMLSFTQQIIKASKLSIRMELSLHNANPVLILGLILDYT